MRPLCSTAMRRAPCRAEDQEVCDAPDARCAARFCRRSTRPRDASETYLRFGLRIQNLSMITGASMQNVNSWTRVERAVHYCSPLRREIVQAPCVQTVEPHSAGPPPTGVTPALLLAALGRGRRVPLCADGAPQPTPKAGSCRSMRHLEQARPGQPPAAVEVSDRQKVEVGIKRSEGRDRGVERLGAVVDVWR
jgi:hypothetical protein